MGNFGLNDGVPWLDGINGCAYYIWQGDVQYVFCYN